MQHLIPLYLILSIIPGIAALTVLSVLALRIKNKGLTYYLIANSCFMISILVNLVMFYQGINVSKQISSGIYALISLSFPFSILMHISFPLAVNELTHPPGKYWINFSIILLGVLELAVSWTPLIIRYSREAQIIIFGPLFPFVGYIQMILIVYSLGMIIIRRKTIIKPTIRRYILTMTGIIAIFIPAIGYDQFYFAGVKSINTVPIAVILSPAFYAVLSLATIFFGMQIMLSPEAQSNKSELIEKDKKKYSLDTIVQNMADKSGLSDREITIIHLIDRGLGNKQIALELNISSKTVANHIYNTYRKLNISSRYELLNLLK